jgi:hypothetical protein
MKGVTAVTANNHPLESELVAALRHPGENVATLGHLEDCLACAVRFARLQRAAGPVTASTNSLQRIMEASTPLPEALADLATASSEDVYPQPDEVWRVGRSEAVLVWVRQVFDDGAVDVVPVVLDIELADRESVIVGSEATPLATNLAAMVALRTHVHIGAFLNRIGHLDIHKEVSEVMTAVREGRRPSGVRVGPPIDDDGDQRLEYRQALRDVLSKLSPSTWLESQQDPETDPGQETQESSGDQLSEQIEHIKAELNERLPDLHCRESEQVGITTGMWQTMSVLKVVYLDAAVLVAVFTNERLAEFPGAADVAKACMALRSYEPDVEAVAVCLPREDWPTQLFASAYMRPAFELPGGTRKGPAPTVQGLGIVDTLHKYFQDVMTPWEVTEPIDRRTGRVDYREIATRHAQASIAQVTAEGARAHQAAKKTAWQKLPDELEERVATFILAAVSGEALDQALAALVPEAADD